jgi:tripartite-type tricarboxylate transporter receptor subunit TctC
MTETPFWKIATGFAFLLTSASMAAAQSQAWPDRPMKMIVTQAAGGTPDILARMVTDEVAKIIGQGFTVENRPGGGNVIGAQAAARATPDGYTFLWATAAALVTNPHTFKALPYDPLKDFVAVGKVAEGPFVLLAHPDVPAKTLPELIAYAKANPAKLNFATDGAKNFSGLLAAWLNKLGGVDIPQVAYSTMPQGAQDTLAGRVQLTILAIPSAAPLMEAGKLKALGLSMSRRAPGFDSVPTIGETFPGFDFTGWMMVSAPAGTQPDVLTKFNRALETVLTTPEMVKRLREIGFYTDGAGTLAEAAAFVREQHAAWGRVVEDIGLKPE